MTNGENGQPLNILLSRDELLLVLSELDSDFLPGLDADPLGELTAEQQSLALTVAGRGLMARELAGLTEAGDLVLHTALLTAVGVCAYSQNALFAYHWPAGSDAPTRYFGHIRGDVAVAHTRPQEVLHLFSMLPSKTTLVDEVVAFAGSSTSSEKSNFSNASVSSRAPSFSDALTISGADFGRARELASAGDADAAALALGGPEAGSAAIALADTLAGAPDVTIMQTLKQLESGDVQKRDFTLIASQNGHGAWLVIAGADDAAPLTAKPAGSDELRSLLGESI